MDDLNTALVVQDDASPAFFSFSSSHTTCATGLKAWCVLRSRLGGLGAWSLVVGCRHGQHLEVGVDPGLDPPPCRSDQPDHDRSRPYRSRIANPNGCPVLVVQPARQSGRVNV